MKLLAATAPIWGSGPVDGKGVCVFVFVCLSLYVCLHINLLKRRKMISNIKPNREKKV